MDVGLELRQARERRGMSLLQLSNTTKISVRVLQAIEASDESRIPARVFTRGFVRAYAAEVGLNPDDTARRYLDQIEPPPPPDVEPERDAETERQRPPTVEVRSGAGRVLRGRFGTATVLALAAVAAFALSAGARRHEPVAGDAGPQPVATNGVSAGEPPQPAPAGTTGTTPASAGDPHVAIAPTGPCWVQASAGETRLFGVLLNAGDRRTIEAAPEITLRAGDPDACALTIDGRPARVPGVRGRAVTVHITRANSASFLVK